MSFHPIYYISISYPSFDKAVSMIGQYAERGASALQIDLPSSDPVYETDMIKEAHKRALETYKGYDVYLNALHDVKQKYPHLQLHLVVYLDVVEAIGRNQFVTWCKENKTASVMIAGGHAELTEWLRSQGVVCIGRINRMLLDEELAELAKEPIDRYYNYNYRRHPEIAPHGCVSFRDKIQYIRKAGVKGHILAVEGIGNEEMMQEVKEAGCDGALVGNVLMRLWDEPEKLWKLFDSFEKMSEE